MQNLLELCARRCQIYDACQHLVFYIVFFNLQNRLLGVLHHRLFSIFCDHQNHLMNRRNFLRLFWPLVHLLLLRVFSLNCPVHILSLQVHLLSLLSFPLLPSHHPFFLITEFMYLSLRIFPIPLFYGLQIYQERIVLIVINPPFLLLFFWYF